MSKNKVVCTWSESTETYRIVSLTASRDFVIEKMMYDALAHESWINVSLDTDYSAREILRSFVKALIKLNVPGYEKCVNIPSIEDRCQKNPLIADPEDLDDALHSR